MLGARKIAACETCSMAGTEPALPDARFDELIATLEACTDALGSPAVAKEVVFVDDFSRYVDDLRIGATVTASPLLELAARYSTIVKAAVHVLLQIRELQAKERPPRCAM